MTDDATKALLSQAISQVEPGPERCCKPRSHTQTLRTPDQQAAYEKAYNEEYLQRRRDLTKAAKQRLRAHLAAEAATAAAVQRQLKLTLTQEQHSELSSEEKALLGKLALRGCVYNPDAEAAHLAATKACQGRKCKHTCPHPKPLVPCVLTVADID
jgi:hypothetical protein